MITVVIVGTIAVVWIFVTFIVRDHHVLMTRQADSAILYTVDDGKTFPSPESCVQHCISRRCWNRRNTVRISTDGSVGTNELQYLGDMMCHHYIYPTTLETKRVEEPVSWEYRPGQYLESFSNQQQKDSNQAVHHTK